MASVLISAVKQAFGATHVMHGVDIAITGGAFVSSPTRGSYIGSMKPAAIASPDIQTEERT